LSPYRTALSKKVPERHVQAADTILGRAKINAMHRIPLQLDQKKTMNQIHTYQSGKDQPNGALNEGASLMASACQDQMRALIGLLRRKVKKSAEPLDMLAEIKSGNRSWLDIDPQRAEKLSDWFFDGPGSYRPLLLKEGYNLQEEHIFAFGPDPKLKVPLDGQENQVFIGLVILGITVERMAENLACTQQEIMILIERALRKLDLI